MFKHGRKIFSRLKRTRQRLLLRDDAPRKSSVKSNAKPIRAVRETVAKQQDLEIIEDDDVLLRKAHDDVALYGQTP